MKILFVSPEAGLGGAERCLIDLLRELPALLPDAERIVLALADGPLLDHVRSLGVRVVESPLPATLARLGEAGKPGPVAISRAAIDTMQAVRRLRRIVGELSPDLIHSNGMKSHALLGLALHGKVPQVWHMHDFLGARRRGKALLRAVSGPSVELIANSSAVLDDLRRTLPRIPASRVLNGIDTTELRPGPASPALGERLQETIRIGLVATYAHWKGHEVFLRAIGEACTRVPHRALEFFIIGGPIYRSAGSQLSEDGLRATAERLGIADRVRFIPFQLDIAGVYNALDVVVHASTAPEPFGRTIAEAMACGRAVIASASGGTRELFTEGKDALAFLPGDATALAAAIARLADDGPLRRKLGAEARETAVSRLSSTRYAREIADVYRRRLRAPRVTIAMGYAEDEWHSMRQVAEGISRALTERGAPPALHAPRCGHRPTWRDRRLAYPRTLGRGEILHLVDQSYADAILTARAKFDRTIVVVNDLAFWHTRSALNDFFRRRIRRGIELADCRVAISEAIADEARRTLGVTIEAVVPIGLPVARFPHLQRARPPGRLIHVGGTTWRKGIDRAIRFLAGLPESYTLLHVGSPLMPDHQELANRLGVSSRITDSGYLPLGKLAEAYGNASALIFPSRYEGFGIPCVEARLCGTPTFASAEVPALELLATDPGTVCLDFAAFDENGTPERRAAACAAFLAAPAGPVVLTDRQRFDWSRVAEAFQAIYDGWRVPLREKAPATRRNRSDATK